MFIGGKRKIFIAMSLSIFLNLNAFYLMIIVFMIGSIYWRRQGIKIKTLFKDLLIKLICLSVSSGLTYITYKQENFSPFLNLIVFAVILLISLNIYEKQYQRNVLRKGIINYAE